MHFQATPLSVEQFAIIRIGKKSTGKMRKIMTFGKYR